MLFTTLKGIVNRTQPRIYTYDNAVRGEDGKYNWLDSLGLGHTDVADNWSLIAKYRSEINGIVVYDDALPDTLNLATTVAGLNGGIVAAPSLVSKPDDVEPSVGVPGLFLQKCSGYVRQNYGELTAGALRLRTGTALFQSIVAGISCFRS
ncbi:GxGYxYP domain-containing protein [Cohnella thermotolerans]|uniref:GxGYxYP domain-containing protein n=1 Tax=Cohnella thermotolerans TaxID=329858 RepID=UPI0003FA14D9|nr:GxGYxYP domain-containing protein [Cohnella thermotolerans]